MKHILKNHATLLGSWALVSINILFIQSSLLGSIATMFFLLALSYRLGTWFTKEKNGLAHHDTKFARYFSGLGILTLLIIIFGGAIYFLFSLSVTWIFVVLGIITTLAIFIVPYVRETSQLTREIFKPNFRFYASFVLFFIFFLKTLSYLVTNETLEAVRTPWELLPTPFWIFTFSMMFFLFLIINTAPRNLDSRQIAIFLLMPACAAVFLFLTIPLLLFPLGFGYDPFIHKATERVIFEQGVVTPKPIYYIGQYALVVILSKILSLSVSSIDSLLIPILATFFLVPVMFTSIRGSADNGSFKLHLFTSLFFFTIPFSYIIVTTPQGLGYLSFILFLFLSLPYLRAPTKRLLAILILLSLATISLHPITGIPTLLGLGFILIINNKSLSNKIKNIAKTIVFLIGCVIFPLLFFLNSFIGTQSISFIRTPEKLFPAIEWPEIPNRYDVILDFVQLAATNIHWIILILSSISCVVLWKRKQKEIPIFFASLFIILLVNAWMLDTFFQLDFVINYEQNDYTKRLITSAWYSLLPLASIALYSFFTRVLQKPIFIRLFFLFLFAALITANLYATYPRHDRYVTGRGYNASIHDFRTVDAIEKNSADERYIVLSHQMLGVAALTLFGFERFYDTTKAGELYFYPIPTSSPLYDYYLQMVNESPTYSTMEQAMNLMNVDVAYLAVNDYWADAKEIIEAGTQEADEIISIDNGKVTVLKYKRR